MEGRDPEIGENKIRELMAAVDAYIPQPPRLVDEPFLMPIEDVFSISGRGTVVTGRVERGVINVGDEIEIVGIHLKFYLGYQKVWFSNLRLFLQA